jgi:hypothetical protein
VINPDAALTHSTAFGNDKPAVAARRLSIS